MVEFKNKEVGLVFENCEHMTIVGDISFEVDQKEKTLSNVRISIPKESNGVHDFWETFDETTKFNRILKHDDIVQIEMDGLAYGVDWYEESEYTCSEHNEYQHTYRKAEDGSLVITISTENKKHNTEDILYTLSEFMNEYPAMSFGEIVHVIECRLGSSVIDAKNETVIAMLDEMMMEAI